MDLSLSFLSNFVEQEALNGKPRYEKNKSLSLSSIGVAHSRDLNFKAYQPEAPVFNLPQPSESINI
jgi:hypothetical protein